MSRDGKRQANEHAARVALDGRVKELANSGEIDDIAELGLDFCLLHPKDRAIQVDVFSAGELGMESGSDLQQAGDMAAHLNVAFRGVGDPREDLQQSAFARPV
jgi:hypothetical protein